MKKLSFYFGIFFVILFIRCENKKPLLPYKKLQVYNKAQYFFGGYSDVVIDAPEDLDFVLKHIERLKKREKDVMVNSNFGYFEIRATDIKDKSNYILDIAMTEFYGDVIIYKRRYYYDQELVDFIKKKLEIPLDRKPIIKKQ